MASARQDLWLTEPLGGTDDPIDAEMEREDLGLMTSIGYQGDADNERFRETVACSRSCISGASTALAPVEEVAGLGVPLSQVTKKGNVGGTAGERDLRPLE